MDNFKLKYLKYKTKYIKLKSQFEQFSGASLTNVNISDNSDFIGNLLYIAT